MMGLAAVLSAALAALVTAQASLAAAAPPQVVVAGRQVAFERLSVAGGGPVVAANDSGLNDFLRRVGATLTWDPGARYASIARLDGKIITLTAGSNAISVDGAAQAIPAAPFIRDSTLVLPLLPLARALGLDVREFRGGYAFVPTIAGIDRRIGLRRTIVEVVASAPLAWRSAYAVNAREGVVTLTFEGFATELRGRIGMGGRDATVAEVRSGGPPGFPTTTLAVHVPRGMRFAAHRTGAGTMDLVLARDENQLRVADFSAAPVVRPRGPSPASSPLPTQRPSLPAGVPPSTAPTAAPSAPGGAVPEPTDNPNASPVPTAQPVFVTPAPLQSPSSSPQPGPSTPAKVTDAFATDLADATRITLTVSGPVSFDWHRLGEPDNRFWVDIHGATLVGPSRTLASKLPFITDIKVSQNKVDPDPTVRVAITPRQAIAVRLGPVANSPDQLGIEIGNAPPGPAEPTSGAGTLMASATPPPGVVTPGAPRRDLIVLDPGHGGNDPGASNRAYGLVEKTVTLAIARMVRDLLVRDGWKVALTRDGDNEVGDPSGADKQELQARCDVANAAGARAFVSIHVNSSFSSAPDGTTTYYWRQQDRAFAQAMQSAVVASAGFGDAGIRREKFYVLNHTVMPSVLLEVSYLSNPHDAALLAQPGTLQRLAAGIARGITDFTGGPR